MAYKSRLKAFESVFIFRDWNSLNFALKGGFGIVPKKRSQDPNPLWGQKLNCFHPEKWRNPQMLSISFYTPLLTLTSVLFTIWSMKFAMLPLWRHDSRRSWFIPIASGKHKRNCHLRFANELSESESWPCECWVYPWDKMYYLYVQNCRLAK